MTFPSTGSTGLNDLIIRTNPWSGGQGETNQDNNVYAIPITLTANLPSITLGISHTSVTEDGTTNLTYTFTRTGPTTTPLAVKYTVGGSATLGVDYTGIAAKPPSKTITFAVGASTAKVEVDPKADTSQETNETVSLTLVSGTGYTLGTTTAVTGIIRNDDLIGTDADNTLVGTALDEYIYRAGGKDALKGNGGQDRLDGGPGGDVLTGGIGADIFLFRYQHSLLSATGAALPAPRAFSRASNSAATTLATLVAAVFSDANGATAGKQPLATNSAALVLASAPAIAGTYLVVNDAVAGFQVSNDLVVNLTALSSALPALGSIPVGAWFA